MKDLNRKVGEVNYDGLISDINPPVEVRGRVIAKMESEQTFPRGTVFSISKENGKLYPLGSTAESGDTLTPDCILCDDTKVGTSDDVSVTVYTVGCFNTAKVTVEDGYSVTRDDFDELRKRGIVFKSAFDSN
ncbi:MAG: head decoration protein [Oscillospiraceae bacterium]|nr:head decoration protein [Oscillospiraceae bacterium]